MKKYNSREAWIMVKQAVDYAVDRFDLEEKCTIDLITSERNTGKNGFFNFNCNYSTFSGSCCFDVGNEHKKEVWLRRS